MNDETLFHVARELPPEGRRAFLENACAGDAAHVRRILDLVEADSAHDGFLEGRAAGVPPLRELALLQDASASTLNGGLPFPPAPAVHDRIGRYELLQKIGEGGMGIVFMAEQKHPVRRKVAVKVIRPGMNSRQVLARFEAEQQALALMNHPSIAAVLDAGVTDAGVPYFVMELVKGVPITTFCDERKLTPRERLDLLIPVCHAVQHAHQKGIIHRDLKPSNILVALYDGLPTPKVIDFGVAKAIDLKLTDRSFFTEFGTILGTLEYMSPEQAQLNQLDIDTRSDVYALGVLLYELLTGTTPIGRARLQGTTLLEALRLVRDEDPPAPSTRIGTIAEIATVADRRGLPPHELRGVVHGELDWVVMKSLEKDRNRRYDTPGALAADLRRYLDDEPVAACPPSRSYRLRKLARKHRAALFAATAFLVILIVSAVVSVAFAIHATDESSKKTAALRSEESARAEARQAGAQAMDALRALSDDVIGLQIGRKAQLDSEDRARLGRILGYYESFAALKGDGLESRGIRAEGHFRVAALRARLGDSEGAAAAFRVASGLYRDLAAEHPEDPEYARAEGLSHRNLGSLASNRGRFEESLNEHHRGIEVLLACARAFPGNLEVGRALAGSQAGLGDVLEQLSRWEEAEDLNRRAARTLEPFVAAHPGSGDLRSELSECHSNLGQVERRLGKIEEGIVSFRRARLILEKLVEEFPESPEYRQSLADAHNQSAGALKDASRDAEAREALLAAIGIGRSLAARFPALPNYRLELATYMRNLAVLLQGPSELHEALELAREAEQIARRLDAEFPGNPLYRGLLGGACHVLGCVLDDLDRREDARAAMQEALKIREALAADHTAAADNVLDLAATCCNFANLLLNRLNMPDAALSHYGRAIELLTTHRAIRPDHAIAAEFIRNSHLGRALAYQSLGRHEESLQDLARVIELSEGSQRRHFQLARIEWLIAADPDRASVAAATVAENAGLLPAECFDLACLVAKIAKEFDDAEERAPLEARSLALLERALAAGWFRVPENLARLRSEVLLNPIRTLAGFEALSTSAASTAVHAPAEEPSQKDPPRRSP